MVPRNLVLAFSAIALCAAAPALAQSYLPQGAAPDATRYLAPPPAPGSQAEKADRAAFRATRRLQGSARWSMAASDAIGSPQAVLQDFGCALGVMADEKAEPTLFAMYGKVMRDARAVIDPPKDLYSRKRPYLVAKGAICTPRSKAIDESGSYPSGHSTVGWTTALILAELAPDRATEILARGRAYGESRVVCGVHYPSDVEAGRTDASGFVAVLHASPEFRADMEKAKAELEAARAAGASSPEPARCKVEADASGHRPW